MLLQGEDRPLLGPSSAAASRRKLWTQPAVLATTFCVTSLLLLVVYRYAAAPVTSSAAISPREHAVPPEFMSKGDNKPQFEKTGADYEALGPRPVYDVDPEATAVVGTKEDLVETESSRFLKAVERRVDREEEAEAQEDYITPQGKHHKRHHKHRYPTEPDIDDDIDPEYPRHRHDPHHPHRHDYGVGDDRDEEHYRHWRSHHRKHHKKHHGDWDEGHHGHHPGGGGGGGGGWHDGKPGGGGGYGEGGYDPKHGGSGGGGGEGGKRAAVDGQERSTRSSSDSAPPIGQHDPRHQKHHGHKHGKDHKHHAGHHHDDHDHSGDEHKHHPGHHYDHDHDHSGDEHKHHPGHHYDHDHDHSGDGHKHHPGHHYDHDHSGDGGHDGHHHSHHDRYHRRQDVATPQPQGAAGPAPRDSAPPIGQHDPRHQKHHGHHREDLEGGHKHGKDHKHHPGHHYDHDDEHHDHSHEDDGHKHHSGHHRKLLQAEQPEQQQGGPSTQHHKGHHRHHHDWEEEDDHEHHDHHHGHDLDHHHSHRKHHQNRPEAMGKRSTSQSKQIDDKTWEGEPGLVLAPIYNPAFLHIFRVRMQQMHALLNYSVGILPLEEVTVRQCPWKGPSSLLDTKFRENDITHAETECETIRIDTRTHAHTEVMFLASRMGTARDMDVFAHALMTNGSLMSMLSKEEAGQMRPFQAFIGQHRLKAHWEILNVLRSKRVQRLFETLHSLLLFSPKNAKEREAAQAPDADMPMAKAAGTRMWNKYQEILQKGTPVANASAHYHQDGGKVAGYEASGPAVHQVRKDLKDLAYYMEMFGSTLKDKRTADLSKDMEELLQTLGDFQDARVHRQYLRHFLTRTEKPPLYGNVKEAREMAHVLLQRVAGKELHGRKDFGKLFLKLSSEEAQKTWRDVLRVQNAQQKKA